MHRTQPLAGALLALLIAGYVPRPLAAPPPPPEGGCVSDDDCDDGDLCNGAERCVGPEGLGRCRRGVAKICRDLDPCTSDSCVANECIHDPIPDCPASTTTSTTAAPSTTTSTTTSPSTTTTASTSSTTATLPTPTTSTIDPSTPHATTTTTSTTVPGQACTPSDPARCDDGDPCTADSCAEAGTCTHLPLTGVASVACICDRAVPAACQRPLPPRVTRLVARGCRLARQALDLDLAASRQRPLLRRADRAFTAAAARTIGFERKGALGAECADALAAALRDAGTRARAARGHQ